MSFFLISPVSKESPGRTWITDGVGAAHVEHHYRTYSKDQAQTVDRWHEFKMEPCKRIYIDFGGMICTKEPTINFQFQHTKFGVRLTHLPIFKDMLKSERFIKNEDWCCRIWHWNHCYGLKARTKLLAKITKLCEKHQDDRIRFEKFLDQTYDEINANSKYVKIAKSPLTSGANCSNSSTN